MKKVVEYIKGKRGIPYILIIIIGFLVSIPLLWVQVCKTHDGVIHLIRTISVDLSFNNGQFPFLLVPFFCRNFGYTMTAFYPPLVTYIPYILGLIAGSAHIGIKLFAALTIVFSGIFMYNFVNEITKNKAVSFLSAIIYMTFPYHLELIFKRFAIGEFTALAFIPLVFQGVYNLLNGNKKKHFYIAIGGIGLMLSHTITTMYTAIFCLIYILFDVNKFLKKEVITKCIINTLFILLITAFFSVPLLEFKNEAYYSIFDPGAMNTNIEKVEDSAVEPWQFLKDKDVQNGVSFVLGIPTVIMLCISILAYQYVESKYKELYKIHLILGLFLLFMCTKVFPWKYMPQILNNIQFPWRLIGLAMFFLAPIFAMNVYYLLKQIKKETIKDILYIAILVMVAIFTTIKLGTYPSEKAIDGIYEENVRKNPIITHWQVNRDYLPYKALLEKRGYMETRKDKVYVLKGKATIENERKKALNMTFDIINVEANTTIELPYLFYPGYTVMLENKNEKEKLDTIESEKGFVQVILTDNIEKATITVQYTGTNLEKVSYTVSGISLIGFILYIAWNKKKKTENKI